MIKLTKHNVPDEILTKINDRAKRYDEFMKAGEQVPESLAGAYKAPEVKHLLRKETADKCAYCESKIPHIDYGDVEHILPKSIFPNLRYAYENLTYACSICNTKKGDYYSKETSLLNPYLDFPEEHLLALGPMVLRAPGSDRGLVTEKLLALNRSELIERRSERLEAVALMVDQIARTESKAIRQVLLAQVEKECEEDKEYAFAVRAYVVFALGEIEHEF